MCEQLCQPRSPVLDIFARNMRLQLFRIDHESNETTDGYPVKNQISLPEAVEISPIRENWDWSLV